MASNSALDFITTALQILTVIPPTAAPSGEDADLGLKFLNAWIDSLGAQRPSMYTLLRTTKTLASGTASYTIGSGGSINIVRPTSIAFANLVTDTGAATPTEIPIDVLSDEQWKSITQKTAQSTMPTGIYYDHGWTAGLGIIYPFPIPNVGTTQLVLYTPLAVTEFSDLSTEVTFPPGYAEAIPYQLAKRLAAPYEKALSPEALDIARDTWAAVKRSNHRPSVLHMDPALSGAWRGGYDILTDRR